MYFTLDYQGNLGVSDKRISICAKIQLYLFQKKKEKKILEIRFKEDPNKTSPSLVSIEYKDMPIKIFQVPNWILIFSSSSV